MVDNSDIPPKKVDLPEYANIPRWLILQGEIDLRLYIIEQMQKDDIKKAPIVKMIDEATGHDQELLTYAQDIIAELRWLKAEYDKEAS